MVDTNLAIKNEIPKRCRNFLHIPMYISGIAQAWKYYMNEEQLYNLIKQVEGQNLDFKDGKIHPRSLAETLAAFAAADGGVILIGVSDNGEVLGVSDFKRIRDNVIYEAGVKVTVIRKSSPSNWKG